MTVVYFTDDSEYLAHYGIKGMKWGVRRYRNEDGSLTSLGKKREEYLAVKKEGKTGYREPIGGGAYAVWPNKRAFTKAVNAKTKKRVAESKTWQDKLAVRNAAKQYKRQVDMSNMAVRSAYREQAKRVKDSMKAEVKNVPVRQITKGRHRTEQIITRVAAAGMLGAVAVGTYLIEEKLG